MPDFLVWCDISLLIEGCETVEDAIQKAIAQIYNSNLIHEDLEIDRGSIEELE